MQAFRTKKEVIKAQYSAAQVQAFRARPSAAHRVGALSGISEEMGDVTLAVERAETKTETLKAKAGAIDELVAVGVLDDVAGGGKDDLDRQLEQMSASASVESELAALKAGLPDTKTKELPEGRS